MPITGFCDIFGKAGPLRRGGKYEKAKQGYRVDVRFGISRLLFTLDSGPDHGNLNLFPSQILLRVPRGFERA